MTSPNTPNPLDAAAALAGNLPPLLMAAATGAGEAVTALWGSSLGDVVQPLLLGVIGLVYMVYIHEHHASVRADAHAAATVATTRTSHGPDLATIERLVEAKLADLPHLLEAILPGLGLGGPSAGAKPSGVSAPADGPPAAPASAAAAADSTAPASPASSSTAGGPTV